MHNRDILQQEYRVAMEAFRVYILDERHKYVVYAWPEFNFF